MFLEATVSWKIYFDECEIRYILVRLPTAVANKILPTILTFHVELESVIKSRDYVTFQKVSHSIAR